MRYFAVLALAGLALSVEAMPAAVHAQTLPQPIITVSADLDSVVTRPKPRIIRMPWQTGIFQ